MADGTKIQPERFVRVMNFPLTAVDIAMLAEAKLYGEATCRCYSRQIGTMLAAGSTVLSHGVNGPTVDMPLNDDPQYIQKTVVPLLKQLGTHETTALPANTGKCPRKLLNYKSGEKLNFCSCEHAERSAIFELFCDMASGRRKLTPEQYDNLTMYCWCGLPCSDCAKAIVSCGVKRVFFWHADEVYDPSSWMIFERAGTLLYEYDKEKVAAYLNPDANWTPSETPLEQPGVTPNTNQFGE